MARDYEYIDSVACYGEFGNNVFDRLAESRREAWFSDDGSGLIRSQRIRSRFFTDQQRAPLGEHADSNSTRSG